jgi:hypothetical protein
MRKHADTILLDASNIGYPGRIGRQVVCFAARKSGAGSLENP